VKSEDIKRSVRVGRQDRRAAGDAPNLGKLARTRDVGLHLSTRRPIHQSHGEGRSRSSMGGGRRRVIQAWLFLLGAAAFVMIGYFIWQWRLPKTRLQENTRTATELRTQVTSKFSSPTEAEANLLVNQALAVREVEKVTQYFRIGSATPQAVVDFLKAEEASAKEENNPIHHRWLASMDANGLLLESVMLSTQRQGKPHNRLAMLTPDAEGKWLIDFDAFAHTATPSWHELLENNAPSAQVRVFAIADNYYNGPFRDESQWLCYSVSIPDRDDALMAYAKIGSPQAAAMKAIFSSGRRVLRATLEIRRVEGGEPRQFEISRVLAEDWVMGPTPFDERPR
jgi:hypothetical protein